MRRDDQKEKGDSNDSAEECSSKESKCSCSGVHLGVGKVFQFGEAKFSFSARNPYCIAVSQCYYILVIKLLVISRADDTFISH